MCWCNLSEDTNLFTISLEDARCLKMPPWSGFWDVTPLFRVIRQRQRRGGSLLFDIVRSLRWNPHFVYPRVKISEKTKQKPSTRRSPLSWSPLVKWALRETCQITVFSLCFTRCLRQSRCGEAEGSQADKQGDSRSCLIYRQAEWEQDKNTFLKIGRKQTGKHITRWKMSRRI